MMETPVIDVFLQPVSGYVTRRATYQGRSHLVVPVVMMVEGVHDGSAGPVLHLESELSQTTAEWEGRPVTINHPQVGGVYVSAMDSRVTSSIVGLVRNAHMDGSKLKGEAWLDVQLLAAVSPTALQMVQTNQTVEVSIGILTAEQREQGTFNNQNYNIIARNMTPDHLALLPDGIGACSVTAGCGLRVNQLKGGIEDVNDNTELKIDKTLIDLVVCAEGMRARVDRARTALDAMDTEQQVYFLEELYEDNLVYRVRNNTDNTVKFFKQSYSLANDDSLGFEGQPVEVRRKVSYLPINNNSQNMERGKPCATCAEMVNALIANTASRFTEEHREFLNGLDEDQLALLEPMEVQVNTGTEPVTEKVVEKVVEKPAVITNEQAMSALKGSIKTTQDFLNIVPAEMREQFSAGLVLHQERRNELIQSITAYEQNPWSEEELKGMSMDQLNKLASMIKPTVSHTVMGDQIQHVNTDNGPDEVLMPTGRGE